MCNVLLFPMEAKSVKSSSSKDLPESFSLDTESLVKFPLDTTILNGKVVKVPTTKEEYRVLCRQFLTQEDYEEFCVCVMDREYYNAAEKQIKDLVNSYFTFG